MHQVVLALGGQARHLLLAGIAGQVAGAAQRARGDGLTAAEGGLIARYVLALRLLAAVVISQRHDLGIAHAVEKPLHRRDLPQALADEDERVLQKHLGLPGQ